MRLICLSYDRDVTRYAGDKHREWRKDNPFYNDPTRCTNYVQQSK